MTVKPWLDIYPEWAPSDITVDEETLEESLLRAAERYPNRVALDFLGATTSYRELVERARRVATLLRSLGVQRGDTVAVALPNCPQHMYALWGAILTGATVAEMNPLAPRPELHRQITMVNARVVIAWEKTIATLAPATHDARHYFAVDLSRDLPLTSRILLKLPIAQARTQRARLRGDVPAHVASFDREWRKAAPMDLDTFRKPQADDVALYMFTGGTTGKPKAVMLTHRNLVSNRKQIIAWVPFEADHHEVIAGVLPLFHAFGFTLMMMCGLDLAATAIFLPNFDIQSLLAAQKRRPITVLPGVTPMFSRILAEVEKREAAGETIDLSSIRFGVSGAMALPSEVARRWEERTGGFLIEGYGMTESSPVVSGSPMSQNRRPSTLGVPFPGTEVRIANPDNLAEDAADVGEILVRGPQVFAGYLGEPEETEEALFGDWLRTGDLGRWDGPFVVMADRAKEMINSSGFNIYPSEVEEVLREMPEVRDVAVVGIPAAERGESVVAALVLEPGSTVDLAAVRRWAEGKLAHYAMPSSIALFDSLPTSQLGKVMRRSVREQLDNFELTAGVWVKKAGAVAGSATTAVGDMTRETFERVLAGLETTYNLTVDQIQSWASSITKSATESGGAVRQWVDKTAPSQETIAAFVRSAGATLESFATWVVRSGHDLVAGATRSITPTAQEHASAQNRYPQSDGRSDGATNPASGSSATSQNEENSTSPEN